MINNKRYYKAWGFDTVHIRVEEFEIESTPYTVGNIKKIKRVGENHRWRDMNLNIWWFRSEDQAFKCALEYCKKKAKDAAGQSEHWMRRYEHVLKLIYDDTHT